MRLPAMLAVAATLTLFLAVPGPAEAFWDRYGVPVSAAAGDDTHPHLVPDGAGGMIVVWRDSSADIYAQRMDGTGAPVWAEGGVYIGSNAYDIAGLVTDGEGGAVAIWVDTYLNVILAARISPDGTLPWLGGSVEIGTTGTPTNVTVAPNGSDGALIAWLISSGGTQGYIQKIDNDGNDLWTEDGFRYSAALQPNDAEYRPDLASDGAGGALIAYTDNLTPSGVYVQRVYSNETVWSTSGTHANYTSGVAQSGFKPCVALSGAGGAYVAWQRDYDPGHHIDVQIISPTGGRVLAGPVAVSGVSSNDYTDPDIISDGMGGAYIAWTEWRTSEYRIYVQRADAYAHALWTVYGIVMNDEEPGDQDSPRILDAGSGNVVVTWLNRLHGSLPSVHAQKLEPGGTILWDTEETLVLPGGYYDDLDAACDGSGGVMAVISKETAPGEVDIWAQSINAFGSPAAPEPVIMSVTDVPGDQGGHVRITIGSSDRDRLDQGAEQVGSYDVWQRIDGPVIFTGPAVDLNGLEIYTDGSRRFIRSAAGRIFPAGIWELVCSFGASQSDEYICRVSTLADSAGTSYNYSVFTVAAMTTDPSVWFVSLPDSGYSVDNLAPDPPLGLAGEQSFTPEGLQLTWDPNAENDLWYYAVYRGTGSLPVPSMAELVATPQAAGYFDGSWTWDAGYWYLVTAVDIHGNESACSILNAEQVTGDDPMQVPDASFLSRNYPNPFNPNTTIAFGLKERGYVSLRVYDAAGRMVAVLVDGTRPAGRYVAEWNGRDRGGSPAASGVYFYRLTAVGFEKTRKMILLR